MRIEIEISQEEAAALRHNWHGLIGGPLEDVLHRVENALPRPIQVGDKVRAYESGRVCKVIAIHGDMAWVERYSDFHGDVANAFVKVASLAAVESDRNPQ